MTLSPIQRCAGCNASSSESKLFSCAACKVVYYCGLEHEAEDRDAHEHACNAIKKSLRRLVHEDTKLRSETAAWPTPVNPFEDYAGHFWSIIETRDYMRARYRLVRALLRCKTYTAVEAAYEHIMDMLHLCRGGSMGIREVLPALALRLGRDQQCYDFCKWWATTGQDSHYEWDNLDRPYLDVKGADVFEPLPKNFISEYSNLSHGVAITLLKIRLLMDVRLLQNSSMIGHKVPQEILDRVREQLVSSAVVAEKRGIMDATDQTPLIQTLEAQVRTLYAKVKDSNGYFWAALLNPGRHLTARPGTYSYEGLEEMQLVLQYSFDAWTETPGAIDIIRDLMRQGI